MPRHKTTWIEPDKLPDNIRDIVSRFEEAFNTHSTGYTITQLMPYAV